MILPEKFKINLDQVFMVDTRMVNKIMSISKVNSKDVVLDIGAGVGSLTIPLAKKAKKVYAIEIDESLIPILCRNVPDMDNVEVIIADALNMEYPRFNKIVSNLPYNICEPFLWRMIHMDFDTAVLTVPKSFSKLLSGEKKSKINILAENFFNVRVINDIPKQAFHPKPRIISTIICLKPKKRKTIMKDIMLQNDKKLKNGLLNILSKRTTKNRAKEIIKKLKLGAMLNKKVMNLSYAETKKLSRVLNEEKRNLR